MIYLLYGEDTAKARAKTRSLIDSLRAKKPDASFFTMDDEHFSAAELDERISGAGLFEQKYIVMLDHLLQNKDTKDALEERIKEIGASENIFFILEGKLDKKTAVKIEKHAKHTQEFASATFAKKGRSFNIFSLSDAFGKRDKKQAWVLLQKAVVQGIAPEEVHGTLFWGVKSMLLAKDAKTAGEAGLNPFVFNKSASFAKNFQEGELESISSRLVAMYHESRERGSDLAIALEMFVLSV